MNNEETIRELKEYVRYGDEEFDTPFDKAIRFAIKALEQEPCEDAVSRQAVKGQMIKYGFHAPDMTVTEFIEDLPSVLPKRERSDKE